MKEMKFEDIDRQFSQVGVDESLDPEHNYHKSYRYFVDYFKVLDEIEESHFVIAANFTYGWMPTILNFKPDSDSKKSEFKRVVELLNEAKKPARLTDDKVSLIAALVNNSIVGTSKLLHFINPEVYAIWDSRVCRFAMKNYSAYQVNKVENFMDYLDKCDSLTEEADFNKAHEKFEDRLCYPVSPMRVIEIMMFTLGKKLIEEDSKKVKAVNQRAKMPPLRVKTASKIDPSI